MKDLIRRFLPLTTALFVAVALAACAGESQSEGGGGEAAMAEGGEGEGEHAEGVERSRSGGEGEGEHRESGEREGGEHNEGGEGREGGEEGEGEHGEEGGHDEGGEEGEEPGIYIGVDETWDMVRRGARLVLTYSQSQGAFVGTVENTTNERLCAVRVEVHLGGGPELGPTPQVDVAAGESTNVLLSAEGNRFETWTAHPELSGCSGL